MDNFFITSEHGQHNQATFAHRRRAAGACSRPLSSAVHSPNVTGHFPGQLVPTAAPIKSATVGGWLFIPAAATGPGRCSVVIYEINF